MGLGRCRNYLEDDRNLFQADSSINKQSSTDVNIVADSAVQSSGCVNIDSMGDIESSMGPHGLDRAPARGAGHGSPPPASAWHGTGQSC